MADLLSLVEFKALTGVDATNNMDDPQITALIPAASRTIQSFVDRKFEVAAGPATERTFQYDGAGVVDIDDCTSVTSVTTDAGVLGEVYPLTGHQWTAQPGDEAETYYYLLVHSGPFNSFSPEMGFERNLDQYDAGLWKPVTISVTATWGWPAIPADVKLAAAWTIQDALSKPGGDNISAEAIEGYSRSWAGAFSSLALPNRARDLLVNYQRAF